MNIQDCRVDLLLMNQAERLTSTCRRTYDDSTEIFQLSTGFIGQKIFVFDNQDALAGELFAIVRMFHLNTFQEQERELEAIVV